MASQLKPLFASFAFAVAAMGLLAAAPACAETQEEAVAYAFMGLADGAALDRGQTHLHWKQISASPAVYQGHGEGGRNKYDVRFTITQLGDCDYEIRLSGPPNMVSGGDALYATVAIKDISALTPAEFQVAITGQGFCQTSPLNPTCKPAPTSDIFGTIDTAKHAAMVQQVRADACTKP